jgi:hypothetical protein
MKLSDKITSRDQWESLNMAHHYHQYAILEEDRFAWWAHRENARIQTGQYKTTTQLNRLNTRLPHYIHVSSRDPAMIAYTPDAQTGEKDIQIVSTLGKYLSKYAASYTDDVIREFVEAHQSEACAKLEYLDGTDITDIGYGKDSPHSCMNEQYRYFSNMMSNTGGIRPTRVYEVPGIRMAIVRRRDGTIQQRTLVREDTKQYIRMYGSGPLINLLTEAGYSVGNFIGMKLRAIKAEEGKYIVPYIDGDGESGSSYTSSVAVIGEDLCVLTGEQKDALDNAGFRYRTATETAGTLDLDPIAMDEFVFKDAITGDIVDIFDTGDRVWPTISVVDGEVVQGKTTLSVNRALVDFGVSKVQYLGNSIYLVGKADLFDLCKLDTPENRAYYNYVKLDHTFYPDSTEWVSCDEAVRTEDGTFIKVTDAVKLYRSADSTTVFVHKDHNLDGFVKMTNEYNGFALYTYPEDVQTYEGVLYSQTYQRLLPRTDGLMGFECDGWHLYNFRGHSCLYKTGDKTRAIEIAKMAYVRNRAEGYGSVLSYVREWFNVDDDLQFIVDTLKPSEELWKQSLDTNYFVFKLAEEELEKSAATAA